LICLTDIMSRTNRNTFNILENDYRMLKHVGEGSFGTVVRAVDKKNNSEVAVKYIPDVNRDPGMSMRTIRELLLLNSLRNSHIISLLDVRIAGNKLFVVSEFCQHDLHAIIYQNNSSTAAVRSLLTVKSNVSSLLYQMLDAVDFMHQNGIIHRDIKPSNVLVTSNLCVKLCDFGFARLLKEGDEEYCGTKGPLTEYMVTRWYRAPEIVITPGSYGKAQDIWSVGCTFAEYIRKYPLFPGQDTLHQLQVIIDVLGPVSAADLDFPMTENSKNFLSRLDSYNQGLEVCLEGCKSVHRELYPLMSKLLSFNPYHRITAETALSSPVFTYFRLAKDNQMPTDIFIPPNYSHLNMDLHNATENERLNAVAHVAIELQMELQNKTKNVYMNHLSSRDNLNHSYSPPQTQQRPVLSQSQGQTPVQVPVPVPNQDQTSMKHTGSQRSSHRSLGNNSSSYSQSDAQSRKKAFSQSKSNSSASDTSASGAGASKRFDATLLRLLSAFFPLQITPTHTPIHPDGAYDGGVPGSVSVSPDVKEISGRDMYLDLTDTKEYMCSNDSVNSNAVDIDSFQTITSSQPKKSVSKALTSLPSRLISGYNWISNKVKSTNRRRINQEAIFTVSNELNVSSISSSTLKNLETSEKSITLRLNERNEKETDNSYRSKYPRIKPAKKPRRHSFSFVTPTTEDEHTIAYRQTSIDDSFEYIQRQSSPVELYNDEETSHHHPYFGGD